MAIKGSSEVIKTPEEQRQIRRNAQAKRRKNGKATNGRAAETLTQGLRDDFRDRQIAKAADILDRHMVSTAPSVQEELRFAGAKYADVYFTAAGPHDVRHTHAVSEALKCVTAKGAKGYAERVLACVHREVSPRKLRNS